MTRRVNFKKSEASRVVVQIVFSLLLTLFFFLPTEFYLLVKYAFAPTGFWQNLILLGVALWVLGGLQFIMFLAWAFFMFALWTS